MEKRIASILIVVKNGQNIDKLNSLLSKHSSNVIGRQGIPLRDKGYNIISLLIEGSTDTVGTISGQLGQIEGIQVKSVSIVVEN